MRRQHKSLMWRIKGVVQYRHWYAFIIWVAPMLSPDTSRPDPTTRITLSAQKTNIYIYTSCTLFSSYLFVTLYICISIYTHFLVFMKFCWIWSNLHVAAYHSRARSNEQMQENQLYSTNSINPENQWQKLTWDACI